MRTSHFTRPVFRWRSIQAGEFHGQQEMKKHISLILCCVLSVVVLNTCIQIEVWNYLAGGNVLPNREGGKLRYSIGETEEGWRMIRGIQDPTLKTGRPLIEEERSEFRKHQKHANRRNKVVSWSRGMGTLQYLLAPIAVIWSIILLFTGKNLRARLLAALFSVSNSTSIILMLYRGYFND